MDVFAFVKAFFGRMWFHVDDQKKIPNRLINEKSPYLLQHAYNPVDWYPWGKEAFEKAKLEDKPVFLSIGYSTCHWCHVMERESFEDDEVADVLNKYFISVKVDREERPDIDSIYMDICQMMNGNGGWPLTIIMTPDKKPFFAGTYFPKNNRYGHPGLIEILNAAWESWHKKRAQIAELGDSIVETINSDDKGKETNVCGMDTVEGAFKRLAGMFDAVYGGFGNAPKFPMPHILLFLLRYMNVTEDNNALEIVNKTLESMYKGGIFDHIGFGFSRYSTDRKWLVPHFEKMLYDNALLSIAYAEGYAVTKRKLYRDVCKKILAYALRNMKSRDGGFYCAEDADSEGVEGKFYLWTKDEIESVIGEADAKIFCGIYGIDAKGNFGGKCIPNLINTDIDGLENDATLTSRLECMINKLYEYREKRIHPFKDDKILTSVNGLMIASLAYAGRIFADKVYISAAKDCADFVLDHLVRDDGRLMARYREGDASYLGYLDDYSFFIYGLIQLYESTFDLKYLEKAAGLNNDMIRLFWDKEDGGFFSYGSDSEKLIARPKQVYDGAVPSGNSVAAYNLMMLAKITKDTTLEDKANKLFETFSRKVNDNPCSYCFFLAALLLNINHGEEIVISGSDANAYDMLSEINRRYMPFSSVVLNDGKHYDILTYLKDMPEVCGKTAAYLCRNFTCNRPVTEKAAFAEMLDKQHD